MFKSVFTACTDDILGDNYGTVEYLMVKIKASLHAPAGACPVQTSAQQAEWFHR